jgi:hypothetical protein
LPEYSDVQDNIDEGLSRGVRFVCVLTETIYFLTELIRFRVERQPDHPLSGFDYPYCIMSIEIFEFAVQVAHERRESLAQVLDPFWEQAGELELTASAPELFDGHHVDATTLFGVTFVKPA